MANTIRISRSTTTNTPSSLLEGELAHSQAASPNSISELFIGITGPGIQKLITNTGGDPAEPNQTITTGTGIGGAEAGSQADVTLTLEINELGVTTVVGGDWLAFDDAGLSRRALISAINLGLFNNDQNWIPASGGTFTGNVLLDGPISTSDFGTGGSVKDGVDTAQPIGFNTMPIYEPSGDQNFDLGHVGMLWHKNTGVAVTYTCLQNTTVPTGAIYVVHNDDSENLLIAQGSGVTIKYLAAGGVPISGNVSIDQGAIVTVYKYTDTEFWVWGATTTGASGSLLGLSDTNITTPNDASMLIYDTGGAEWRDVLMSNHGSLTDTGVLTLDFSNLTDMTGAISGTTEFILQDGTTESRKAASEVGLQFFDNAAAEFVSENDTIVVADWNWVLDEDAMGSNSAVHVATQQSVKAYVDNQVTGAMVHKGGYNASTNTPALDTGSPSLVIGDLYTTTVAGTFFTVALEIGDTLIADVTSSDAASINDWTIVQTNIGAASETVPGYIELATQTEMDTGTDDLRAVTPLKYANSIIDGGTF